MTFASKDAKACAQAMGAALDAPADTRDLRRRASEFTLEKVAPIYEAVLVGGLAGHPETWSDMIERARTAWWYLQRPSHYPRFAGLVARKLVRRDQDTPLDAARALRWATERAVRVPDALSTIELLAQDDVVPDLPRRLLDEGEARARRSSVAMGGAGDVHLLYAAVVLSGARRVVETGVAFGWSSLAILTALEGRPHASLVSVDMAYPKLNNEAFIGIVVPERLRGPWEIIREPDRFGLRKAIARQRGIIDLCHYDSDKSWWGRRYAYPLLWRALSPGGVFISDDIQDNTAFAEFIEERRVPFAVTEYGGKYVGIARKAGDDPGFPASRPGKPQGN